MKPTKEQAAYFLPFVRALAEGKTIEWREKAKSTGIPATKWEPLLAGVAEWFVEDDLIRREFRIKPEVKLRAWKASEVPVGAIIRSGKLRSLITAVDEAEGIVYGGYKPHEMRPLRVSELFDSCYEYSIDGGKTFAPCGVKEGE
jgi:hypothetical protein